MQLTGSIKTYINFHLKVPIIGQLLTKTGYHNIPALHSAHELNPVVLANVPGEHFSHFVLLITLQNLKKVFFKIYFLYFTVSQKLFEKHLNNLQNALFK